MQSMHKKTSKSTVLEGLNVLENSVREFSLLELSWFKNPGIFCPVQNKILEFSPKFFSQIPWQIGIPGIFWSHNFPSCNVLSGNFLSRNFVSRKIHGFVVGTRGWKMTARQGILFVKSIVVLDSLRGSRTWQKGQRTTHSLHKNFIRSSRSIHRLHIFWLNNDFHYLYFSGQTFSYLPLIRLQLRVLQAMKSGLYFIDVCDWKETMARIDWWQNMGLVLDLS